MTDHEPEPTAKRVTSGGRGRRRWPILISLMVIAWLIASSYLLVTGAAAASHAADSLTEFSDETGGNLMSITRLVSDDMDLSKVRSAKSDLNRAKGRFDSPLLAPFGHLPVVGRQLRSAKALAHSASKVTDATLDAFDEVASLLAEQEKLDPKTARSGGRLAAADDLKSMLEGLRSRITNLDLGPKDGLVSQLARARNRFASRYSEATSTLDDAIASVAGAQAFLKGPNQYLVLAANNGEMRSGSGMFLQIGAMGIDGGDFHLGDFLPTEGLALARPGTTLDPTLQPLWGPLIPTREWRNVNLTPRFDESARMATEMWKSSGRGTTDGAMAIDVAAIKKLLAVSGPVTFTDDSGKPYVLSSDNVVDQLLIEQYVALTDAGQDQRRAHLGDVAAAIFESFNNGSVPLSDLLDAFASLGKARHLMMWSSDPVQQAGWEALGMSGTLEEDDMLFSLINRGGNKLDQFIDVSSKVTASSSNGMRHIKVAIDLENVAPIGLPRYVEGPIAELDLQAGDYLGSLSLTVPGGAGNPTSTGGEIVGTAIDGPTKVIVMRVLLHRGEKLHLEIGFDLTSDWKSIKVLPSARIPATRWKAGSLEWSDSRPVEVQLDGLG